MERRAPPSPRPVSSASPVNAELAALCSALDAHAEVLAAQVDASQRQIRAIVGYRVSLRDGGGELADLQGTLVALTQQVGAGLETVRSAAQALGEALGRDGASVKLSDLVEALPARLGAVLAERVSTVRSLSQAVGELQKVSQFHAQRGLQLVAAWRAMASRVAPDAGPAYTKVGRPRSQFASEAVALEWDV